MNPSFVPAPLLSLPLEPLIAAMLSLVVAAVVHLFLWRVRGETYLLLWGLGWLAFAIRYAPMLAGAPLDFSSPLSVIGTTRDVLFMAGASLYSGRRWWRWWIVPAAVEAGCILLGSLRHPTIGPFAVGVRLFAAASALVVVAVVLARSKRPGSAPRRVIIAGLLLLAGVLYVGPLLASRAVEFFAVSMQLGTLALVVGIAFSELDAASAQRLEALRKLAGTMEHVIRGRANVCTDCHRVESGEGEWRSPEAFIHSATSATVTHGICPPCAQREFGIAVTDATAAT